jgi:hypothetical protein
MFCTFGDIEKKIGMHKSRSRPNALKLFKTLKMEKSFITLGEDLLLRMAVFFQFHRRDKASLMFLWQFINRVRL